MVDGVKKVGNVTATNEGFTVNLFNTAKNFKSKSSIEKNINLKFENYKKINVNLFTLKDWGIAKSYNIFFDLKKKIYVFTKQKKSKCFYVAGWFYLNLNNSWQKIYCPKYIFIQRYEYRGPYKYEHEIDV